MKTSVTPQRMALAFGAMLAFSIGANAQNTSYDADAVPVPGTGLSNAAFGKNALTNNGNGSNNTALGFYAMSSNKDGDQNTVSGVVALTNNINGSENCAYGVKCMASNQYGGQNTAYGNAALALNDGSGNTGIGYLALLGNYQGKLNTGLGYFADVASSSMVNATAIGNGAVVQSDDRVQLGDANVTQIECWSGVYASTSDGRFKFDIKENDVKGLDFINRLRPVVYNMDTRKLTEHMVKNLPEERRKTHLDKDFSKSTGVRQSGFIAQEVEAAAKASGYNFNGVQVPKDDNGHYSVAYSQFVVPLVKAVQEQQQMIESQSKLIESMQQQMTEMRAQNATATGITQLNAESFSMGQNEPNPFTRETVIRYNLPQSVSNAYLAVYDLSGKQITTFAITQKGNSTLTVDGEKLPAGIYIYSVVADGKIMDSKRMVVAGK